MSIKPKSYLAKSGLGALSAAAALMLRNGSLPGGNTPALETAPVMDHGLDAAGDAPGGYSLRSGRMVSTDNFECTWDLYKTIPSSNDEGKTVFYETGEFDEKHKTNSMARLVDRRRANIPVTEMGFSIKDRNELLKFSNADETALGSSIIIDWLSPGFFETEFWRMCANLFAFQPWHSAMEFKHYLHRFIFEFSRISAFADTKAIVAR